MAEPWDPKTVFLKALELPEEQREAYLKEACPDDESRARIEMLLRHHREAGEEFPFDPDKTLPIPPPVPRMIGEFRILHVLGEGGMGVVYLAEDTILGRKVALKVLARHLTGSERALARFREEARNAAALKHPGIVPVFKFDRDGDTQFLVSEFVDGPTLASLIAQRKNAPAASTQDTREWHRRAAQIVAALADALDCAHRADIVHRDIKPSNVLIDPQLGPRITDFGVAKHLTEDNRTTATSLVGSCYYMSPEQASIAEAKVDQRSDIFSLGVVFYEMLALRRPFDGPTELQVLREVIECHPRRLRSVVSSIPRDLETVCHKAIEKEPARRYQTAAHVAADLRCFLDDRPILASPPGLSRRMRQWARVHRRASLAIVFIGMASVSVGAVALAVRYDTLRWRALRCAVELDRILDGTHVYLRAFDAVTYEVGPRTALPGPVNKPLWLLPGQYRFEFVTADGRFAEVDAYLETPGQTIRISPVFVEESSVTTSMVQVPAGTFLFAGGQGSLFTSERSVTLESFWIDVHEVSNKEYMSFLRQTEHEPPKAWGNSWWPAADDDRPVVGITWDDMQAYARWAGKRLPTVLEWERAGRYPDGRLHPCDGGPPPGTVLAEERHRKLMLQKLDWSTGMLVYEELARPVSSDPCPSPLDLHYMAGNVSEMTGSITAAERTKAVIVKGNSWMNSPESWDLSRSRSRPLSAADIATGFRCARSAAPGG
jgi:serine/threonine protein kinase/formylglycine-generating enzyme required for sulfatase activity